MASIVLQGNEQAFRKGHTHMDYNIASSLIFLTELSAEGSMKSMFFNLDVMDMSRIRFVMNQEQYYSYRMKTVCS